MITCRVSVCFGRTCSAQLLMHKSGRSFFFNLVNCSVTLKCGIGII